MSGEREYAPYDRTYASNPGNVGVDPLVWIRHKPITVGLWASVLLLGLWLTYEVSWWFSIAVVLGLAANAIYWVRVNVRFQSGDSNGGIVVSVNPLLLAVSTDLTHGVGYYPVIKIIPYRSNKTMQLGDRVATAALYEGPIEGQDYWNNFNPVPIEYATKDRVAIDRALKSYPDEQWAAIERGLSELDTPYRPGLYRVEVSDSDWASV